MSASPLQVRAAGVELTWAAPRRTLGPAAAQDAFEALLLGEMLKPLEDSLRESGFFPPGAAGEIYAGFWKSHLSELLAATVQLIPDGVLEGSPAAPAAAAPDGGRLEQGPLPLERVPARLAFAAAAARSRAGGRADPVPAEETAAARSPVSPPAMLASTIPGHLAPVVARLRSVDAIVQTAARESGIAANWVRAVITQESGARREAESPRGAQGLMQLMPATARSLGVSDSLNPMENIRGGTRYLSALMKRFDSCELALAAYNAGPGRVEQYAGVPPYPETRSYIRNVMALKDTFDRIWPAE